MAILMPNQKPKEKEESDFDKVIKGLDVAGKLFGVYTDYKGLEDKAAERSSQKEKDEMAKKSFTMQEQQHQWKQQEQEAKQQGRLTPEEQAKFDWSDKPVPGATQAQDLFGRTIYIKPRAPQRDPLAQELAQQRLAEAKRKEQEEAFKKTPEGKLQNLNSSDKMRYDNVLMANRAVQQMAKAFDDGQNAYSLVGDNDYTAALGRFKEAIGRMQSGGAIGDKEADQFINLARTLGDSPEQRQAKLVELNTMMRNRVKTLGFDPDQTQDMGAVTFKPKEKSVQERVAGFAGKSSGTAPVPDVKLEDIDAELQKREIQKKGMGAVLPGKKK